MKRTLNIIYKPGNIVGQNGSRTGGGADDGRNGNIIGTGSGLCCFVGNIGEGSD